jgi:hypothetical protein
MGKNLRLGLAVDYSMLRLLTEGANIRYKRYYKTRSLKNLNVCLMPDRILNKF